MTPPKKRKQHVPVKWEVAKSGEWPILAYCVYVSSLPVLKTRKKATLHGKQASEQMTLVDVSNSKSEQDTFESGERQPITVRLPYTRQALINRIANGRSLPKDIERLIYS